MNSRDLLLIFTKNPKPGRVKTRLAVDIGDQNALKLYRYLLQHTMEVTKKLPQEKWVFYSDEIPEKDIWDEKHFSKKLQQGNDLGERMQNAFAEAFQQNYQKVIIIGSDLYDLQTGDLKQAFRKLDESDVVIGPARDGGYYLLGMKSPHNALFQNKKWSTARVLEDSLANLKDKKVILLEERNDIDCVADIPNLPEFKTYFQ
ncbi:TIGR04282 family arsenosugar biosynthesis glycosyltransferase [Salegentibacter sp. HM20]